MTVHELIIKLLEHDLDKAVYIQQGEEQDYMTVYTVRECGILPDDWPESEIDDEIVVRAVVIDYM